MGREKGAPISRRGLMHGSACSVIALMLSGCTRPKTDASAAKPVTGSTFAFDTYCTFGVYGDDTAPARLADACAHFDALFAWVGKRERRSPGAASCTAAPARSSR